MLNKSQYDLILFKLNQFSWGVRDLLQFLSGFFSLVDKHCHFSKYMQALILAGGKGTRLRPLTVYTPKPVVPFVNRPFLLYQLAILERAGITDITLSLSY